MALISTEPSHCGDVEFTGYTSVLLLLAKHAFKCLLLQGAAKAPISPALGTTSVSG